MPPSNLKTQKKKKNPSVQNQVKTKPIERLIHNSRLKIDF